MGGGVPLHAPKDAGCAWLAAESAGLATGPAGLAAVGLAFVVASPLQPATMTATCSTHSVRFMTVDASMDASPEWKRRGAPLHPVR
jgi:hypothetical protein